MSNIFSIESSCDDTSFSVVDPCGNVLLRRDASQVEKHQQFGGVLPEVASRLHFDVLNELYLSMESDLASIKLEKIAVTCAPGLVGSLLVGVSFAQGLAFGKSLDFVGVHHLRGHVASVLLASQKEAKKESTLAERACEIFPAFVLLCSGGHTQLLKSDPQLKISQVFETRDDAVGECFDKCAKMMGLDYPGGPQIEKLAQRSQGNSDKIKELKEKLPRPKLKEAFSFSGLKSAFRRFMESADAKNYAQEDIAFVLQERILDFLLYPLEKFFKENFFENENFVLCGGVAANLKLRERLELFSKKYKMKVYFPHLEYCMDNAAMIGAAAQIQSESNHLDEVMPRLPFRSFL